MDRLKTDVENKAFDDMSLEELDEYNNSLYADVAGEAYDKSYANPRVCAKAFGEDTGKLMAMVYSFVDLSFICMRRGLRMLWQLWSCS